MGDELIRREKYLKNCKPAMIKSRKIDQKIIAKLSFSGVKRIFADREPAYAPAYGGFALTA